MNLMFGFGGTIARRVNAVMKQRVKDAEARYNDGRKTIKEEEDVEVQRIRTESEGKRMELQDSLVESIIGK